MTKIRLSLIVLAASLVVVLVPAVLAHAEEQNEASSTAPVAGDEMTASDLGVEKTGILPTNPFYFAKEWSRGLKLLFTPDPVKKAALELKIVNEKAAELKRVAENSPQNDEALNRAISNYDKNVERLRARLESLKETSDNPNIDKLLDELADRAIKHQQLFEELKVDRQTLRDRLEQSQGKLDEAILKVPEKLDNPDKFKERIKNALENQKESHLKELRGIQFLSRIDGKASSTEVREKLLELTNDKLASSTARKEIEKEVGAVKAAEMIKKAKEAISELETTIEKVKTSGSEVEKKRLNSVRILFDRARTNLREAENLYKEERYGAAYGQANFARVAARNALAQLLKRVEERKNTATSTDSVKREQKEEQQTETLDQSIIKAREAIKRTNQNIRDTRSKLPASPAGGSVSETATSGTQ
ncbi:MAG: DUF5667 domain-containing protein [Candidatus Colwellbacteria bacterium]